MVNDEDGGDDLEFSFWNYLGVGNALKAWDRTDGVFESSSPKEFLGEALQQEDVLTQNVSLPMSELPASDRTPTNLFANVEHPDVYEEVVCCGYVFETQWAYFDSKRWHPYVGHASFL